MKKFNFRALIGYILGLAIISGLIFWLVPQVKKEMSQRDNTNKTATTQQSKPSQKDGTVVRISIDEWIGWQPLLDANGGLTTKSGSINDKNGIKVEYVVTNDANTSSTALIKGDLSGAGYTINRYAFLQTKFEEAGVKVCMPYISNYSNGGDGIVSKSDIKSVEDLVGKKIAVPKFSEAQTLAEWVIKNSSLSAEAQKQIRDNMVYLETPEDTAKAFFSGEVDAAATWEPFLTQAKTTAGTRVLFDTSMSTNLILDGIIFRQDFLDKNGSFVEKLIDGALEASSMYKKEFKNIKQLPMFELMSNEEIIDMANGADIATWQDNKKLLVDQALTMYKDMANIWISIGEKAYPDKAKAAFTDKYVLALSEKYSSQEPAKKKDNFTEEKKTQAANIDNRDALMKKTLDIGFDSDSAAISDGSYETLNAFADTAKILDNVFIQIEGNTAKVPGTDGKEFSKKRANSVAKYLQAQGVDSSRFIIVGNGDTNPKGDNNTEEGRVLNRRTDVFFKVVGY